MNFNFVLRIFRSFFAPKIYFLDSIISPQKNLGIKPFQKFLLQTSPAPSAPPAPPASSAPRGEAQALILIFIPDYGCFRLEQQLLGHKLRVLVCSELFWAFESNETLFPFQLPSPYGLGWTGQCLEYSEQKNQWINEVKPLPLEQPGHIDNNIWRKTRHSRPRWYQTLNSVLKILNELITELGPFYK